MVTEQPDMKPGDVHVWYRLTEHLGDRAQIAARGVLSEDERSRCDRYRLAADRRDYAAAHTLLRTSLSRYRNIEPQAWKFVAGTYGKPEHANRTCPSRKSLTFNLSRTRGIVACAIAPGAEIGIDVETTNLTFDYSDIMSRYCTREEIAQIERCSKRDRASRFIELWTLKEAYIKAMGGCLTEGLSNFGFQLDGDEIRLVAPGDVDPRTWQFALFAPEPRYRIAVAIACGEVPVWRIDARSSEGQPSPCSTTAVRPPAADWPEYRAV